MPRIIVCGEVLRTLASLTEREANEEFVLLVAPSFQLVILQIPQQSQPTSQSTSRRESANTPIKLFLNVSSIAKARQEAMMLGGELNGSEKEWQFNGVKRCDGIDPEGNVFQLQEAPA